MRKRRLLIAAGAVVGSLILLVLAAWVLIDPLVRGQIRSSLQSTLKTPVNIRSVRIVLAGGARIEGVTILNPPGFKEREAFHLESVEAVTRASVLLRNPIVISELRILQPEFIVDFGDQETNWAALIRNAARQLPRKDEKPDRPPLGFVIRQIQIVQPVIRIAPTRQFPDGLLIRLKDVTLEGIGNLPDSPSTFYVAVAVVLQALITGGTADGTAIPSAIRSRLADELQEGGKAFTEALSSQQ